MNHLHGIARLSAIGNICAQWSFLEYLYALTIWQLLHIDHETGKIVTGGTDMHVRARLAINLAKHLNASKSITKALEAARDSVKAAKLDERRNKAVHGVRFAGSTGGPDSVLIEVHRGAGGRQRHEQTNLELSAIGKEIKAISDQFLAALKESGIFQAPASKPAKIIARNTAAKASGRASQPS